MLFFKKSKTSNLSTTIQEVIKYIYDTMNISNWLL